MTHKVIFINGPPGSGKDQAGMIIKRLFNARTYKMSRPIKDALAEFFLIDYFKMKDEIEPTKDVPHVEYGGLSWRGLQISLAETWAKPLLGGDIFGQLAVIRFQQATTFDITVVTDSGFYNECVPVVQYFGPDACLLIQLTRDECTFEGDSRSYIELDELGVTTVLLHNRYPLIATDDMPITYEMQLAATVRGWLGLDELI